MAAAFEQAHAEVVLQLADSAGEGSLGSAGDPRGATDAAVPRDGIEIGQGEQIHGCSIVETGCLDYVAIGSLDETSG
jgi:hypothetical protein